jgi:alpha,alpha-trehalase
LILGQEDTDRNSQVTIEDSGPKYINLTTANSYGLNYRGIKGHYMIANLLQELVLAEEGKSLPSSHVLIEEKILNENPIYRLCKMITGVFWPNLRRSIDLKGLKEICLDAKNRGKDKRPRIYVPHNDKFAAKYYEKVAIAMKPEFDLEVKILPKEIDEEFVASINEHPGILSLQLRIKNELDLWEDAPLEELQEKEEEEEDGQFDISNVRGVPFIVPGGRFNEMYGWDSYFSVLGLLESIEETNKCRLHDLFLAKSMADNFAYEIEHYGKILNANRSYYLLRTQPPFLTDMTWKIYSKLKKFVEEKQSVCGSEVEAFLLSESPRDWLKKMSKAAIKEYWNVWRNAPRHVKEFGLARYFGFGKGLPPETESSHFNAVLFRFAKMAGYKETGDPQKIAKDYNEGKFKCPALDEYFLHDRAVRESGHDTTYRLDGRCANLLTVDLNSLLYKYEIDISRFLEELNGESNSESNSGSNSGLDNGLNSGLNNGLNNELNNGLNNESNSGLDSESIEEWRERASERRKQMDRWLWNEEAGQYYDFDFVKGEQVIYDSATAFWPLWSGAASPKQAQKLISTLLPKLEMPGGLVSGTEESRGSLSLDRPSRQWDFPFGWAPHQIMLWRGLTNYGHLKDARRLAYRWLFTITKAYVNYHGVVPEKFNVVTGSHRVDVEYGNVGTDFKMLAREGFAWMNASFMIGLKVLERRELRALGALIEPEKLEIK